MNKDYETESNHPHHFDNLFDRPSRSVVNDRGDLLRRKKSKRRKADKVSKLSRRRNR